MDKPDNAPVSRRRLFAGVGTAGALATVAAVLPIDRNPVTAQAPLPKPAPEAGGGYQLTAHVQRYYQTAKV
jgi:hypothetical protein